MTAPLRLDPDRLFPAEARTRDIARALYGSVAMLPIVSPHGHTDPRWFAYDQPWDNAAELLLQPDHYLFRMLYSQGISLEALGIPAHGRPGHADLRAAWRLFADNQHLFRGTPSRLWLDHVFAEVFDFDVALGSDTADLYYDRIGDLLATPGFRPRALYDRFKIELIATTEGA
ncbi:MAG: glucuronate isomerase, partial [Sphingomonas sp.]